MQVFVMVVGMSILLRFLRTEPKKLFLHFRTGGDFRNLGGEHLFDSILLRPHHFRPWRLRLPLIRHQHNILAGISSSCYQSPLASIPVTPLWPLSIVISCKYIVEAMS